QTDVHITLALYTNYVQIQVKNYGEPIPVVDIPHIFNRFYRVEKSRNRYNGGSGLGLAITKEIIEKHNGTIGVKSEDNATIFTICLPLLQKT
ncbi:MAG: sensor histidine kinase, partial [Bacilli bacterium]